MRNGARRGLLAVVVVLAVLGTLAAQSTVSAWTDPAQVRATASAGTWGCVVTGVGGAKVRDCSASARIANSWNSGTGTPWTIQYEVTLDQAPSSGQQARVVVDLSTATGTLPAGFTWVLAGTTSGWNFNVSGTRCADLPVVTGTVAAHQSNLGITVVQNRTTQGPVTCS